MQTTTTNETGRAGRLNSSPARVYFRANQRATNQPIAALRGLVPRRGLSPAEARHVAERQANLLLTLGEVSSPSVPESLITEIAGVAVSRRVNWPTSGMTSLVGDTWAVLISANEAKVRQRFTIAHEFKHILDDPAIEWLYPTQGSSSPEDRAESVCDHFAGCLLMPKVWLREDWRSGRQDISKLAQRYNVSRQAMEVRLTNLGLLMPRPRCAGTRRRGTPA